ncbi:MAG: enoyl-CoA hydratase-related protein [Coxiellaceae bacterium]|nr:enoyl-CoA hydratase-related protein [Coxiellaceae bacterium]
MTKVLLSIENAIATITLNFPEKHNILNPDAILMLSQAYKSALHQAEAHVIILKANGKHFCAGADLSHMLAMGNAAFEENLEDAKKLAELLYLIYASEKPTIAYVQGNVRGGGLGLFATHDIVIAEKNATFSFTEVKLGLLPAVISPFILKRMTLQSAKIKMLTTEVFTAEEALHLQLIDHICNDTEDFSHALTMAAQLAAYPTAALQKTKQWLHTLKPITKTQIHEAAHQLAEARASASAKKIIAAFLKKML